ncbi:MAG: cell division protein FtsQ/DivIB [Pyrinomonadaceae bacterium]
MATKTKRKPTSVKTARPVAKRRPAKGRGSRPKTSGTGRNLVLPFLLSFCILICLGAIGFLGYRTVTASEFFDVASIEVHGVTRASKKDIERIVGSQSERSGVWNADLGEIKQRIEKVAFVKNAAVSQVLPNGIRVDIRERVPKAIVRTTGGDFLVDGDGEILSSVEGNEEKLPFPMTGWDEAKSEKAGKDNVERVKLYQKMLGEWQENDLATRIKLVNLADMRDPRAVTEDSGTTVSIAVGRENFGQHLASGIKAIVGKGNIFEGVDLNGPNMILAPRKSK